MGEVCPLLVARISNSEAWVSRGVDMTRMWYAGEAVVVAAGGRYGRTVKGIDELSDR